MITIYTTPSCSSCRKAKKWLEKYNLPYREVNLFVKDLREEEIKELLARTENGVSDIISERSKIIKEGKVNIEDMSISELVEFVKKNPSILKRPIIVGEKAFNVGYNEEEIRVFIPKELRNISCLDCEHCPDKK